MSYSKLVNQFKKINNFAHIGSIVGWDEAVMMPVGGGDSRADALSELSGHMNDLMTAPEVGEYIQKAESESLSEWETSNLNEIKRLYNEATCLDSEFVMKK